MFAKGRYVLYWMIAARRTRYSFALDHALALRASSSAGRCSCSRRCAPGIAGRAIGITRSCCRAWPTTPQAFARRGHHVPAVRRARRPARARACSRRSRQRACCVVTDEQPGFFLPRMVTAAARAKLAVRLEHGRRQRPAAAARRRPRVSDGRVVSPAAPEDRCRRISRALPAAQPLARRPRTAKRRRAAARRSRAAGPPRRARCSRRPPMRSPRLPIDHTVAPVALSRRRASRRRACSTTFIDDRLARYADDRNHPDDDAASGLSPYLHFGHISAHEIVGARVATAPAGIRRASPARRSPAAARAGGACRAAHEAFLDELVTWRELGYGFCFHRADYDRYDVAARRGRSATLDRARDAIRGPSATRCAELERAADRRSGVERRAAPARRRGPHPQLPAHAVGQEDPRVVAVAARRAGDADRAQQQVRGRRPRPELVQRHLLDARPVRSAVGAGAPDLRDRPLHVLREHRPEARSSSISAGLVGTP